jgi:elongation factor 2
VDAVDGVCVQTETVLRQAMQERIKPVLFINKLDKYINDFKVNSEQIYHHFNKIIEKVNDIIATYDDGSMGDLELHPAKGNVGFGSGKDCWAFTLNTFARFYAKKFNCEEDKLVKKLWGSTFYDPKEKK